MTFDGFRPALEFFSSFKISNFNAAILILVVSSFVSGLVEFVTIAAFATIVSPDLGTHVLPLMSELLVGYAFEEMAALLAVLLILGCGFRVWQQFYFLTLREQMRKAISLNLYSRFMLSDQVLLAIGNTIKFSNLSVVEVDRVLNSVLKGAVDSFVAFLTLASFFLLLAWQLPLEGSLILAVISVLILVIVTKLGRVVQRLGQKRLEIANVRLRHVEHSYRFAAQAITQGANAQLLDQYRAMVSSLSRIIFRNSLIQTCPEFVLEAVLYVSVLVAALWFLVLNMTGFEEALAALSLFFVGWLKLKPYLLSIYSSVGRFKFGIPIVYRLTELLKETRQTRLRHRDPAFELKKSDPKVLLRITDFAVVTNGINNRAVSFSVSEGAWVKLSGKSGCGKTTFLRSLLFISPLLETSGLIEYKSGISIAYVDQSADMFGETASDSLLDKEVLVNEDQVERVFNLLDINFSLSARCEILSGGQKQRLHLARALLSEPDLLILDEAFSAIDSMSVTEIMRRIKAAHPAMGVIYVTHSSVDEDFADEIVSMEVKS